MGVLTTSRVEIAATAQDVYAWLTDPAKATAWQGAAASSAVVTAADAPRALDVTVTAVHGSAYLRYRLVEGDGVTSLVCEADSDEGDTDELGELEPDELDADLLDTDIAGERQTQLDASLARLKALVEAEAGALLP